MYRVRAAGVVVLLLRVALPTAAHAQQFGGVNVLELFQTLDVNNDAVIDRGEVPESGHAAFDRLAKLADTNKDGKIDREEYRALLERARESTQAVAQSAGERFHELDKNGDGRLSRDEFPVFAAMFQRMDADGDGFVTVQEARQFRPAAAAAFSPAAFAARLKAMDRNGDGKVSRAEYTGPPAFFDRIDRSGDGQIDADEVKAFRPGPPAASKEAEPKKEQPPAAKPLGPRPVIAWTIAKS